MFRAGMAILVSTLLSMNLYAQSSAEQFEDVPPPDLPDPLVSGEPIEPEVTIITTEKEVIEEYRVNGKLYQVKVTPAIGPVYYMIDIDGDGELESRRGGLYKSSQVPQWVLFSW